MLTAADNGIPVCPALEPGDVLVRAVAGPVAALEDQWGRRHGLASQALIGRDGSQASIVVDHPSVSRAHAALHITDAGVVIVTDLSSTNGTRVSGRRIEEPTPLEPGGLLEVGGVGFILVTRPELMAGCETPSPRPRSSRRPESRNTSALIFWELEQSGGRYVAVHRSARAQLPAEEAHCLRRLISERTAPDPDQLPQWQGYVRSVDLLPPGDRLSRSTRSIRARAILRRLRQSLSSIGLDGVIVEHERFGYRLRVLPGGTAA